MIISKCPLRVSLVGGATDLQAYLDKYKSGGVVSFPANLYTYIILNEVKMQKEHRIIYSQIEHVPHTTPENITNDIVRSVFTHFDVPPLEITFTSDIPATGSGLAASSSYMIALISAVTKFLGIKMSQYEICKLAVQLERKFNPLTGYQDAYGCGIGSLKAMSFTPDGLENVRFLDASAFKKISMYLCPTNQYRSSTNILNTLDIDKIDALKSPTKTLERHITSSCMIFDIINFSWEKKKETSASITNSDLDILEEEFRKDGAMAIKLLGAGGGGYFLVMYDTPRIKPNWLNIEIDQIGVTTTEI